MSEALPADDESLPSVEFAAEPPGPAEPAVEFVVPAEAYDAIDTEADRLPTAIGAPTPAVDQAPVLDAVRGLGEALGRRLDGLQAAFEREVRAEATREKIVDRLHAELQEYKQDLLLNTLRPLLVDLIQLHDDIGKLVAAQGEAEGEVGRLVGLMGGFQQAIEDILYRQGVEPFYEEGPQFNPRRQRAVATVPTDDPSLAKTVAARLRKGFQAGEKVIRPEIVSVYAPKC